MKTYKRRFRTYIDLNLYTRAAEEVLAAIENDTINVFRADDERATEEIHDDNGVFLLDARTTSPASVREWLPVVCQFIRWECASDVPAGGRGVDDNAEGYYRSNSSEVLWPLYKDAAAGPGALIAGVVLRRQECVGNAANGPAAAWEGLKFIVAHELAHAFHAMRFVVPAFKDWRRFWRTVLGEGTRCDLLRTNANYRTGCLDRYGTELELSAVAQFWPSHAQQWFDAWYQSPPEDAPASKQ